MLEPIVRWWRGRNGPSAFSLILFGIIALLLLARCVEDLRGHSPTDAAETYSPSTTTTTTTTLPADVVSIPSTVVAASPPSSSGNLLDEWEADQQRRDEIRHEVRRELEQQLPEPPSHP